MHHKPANLILSCPDGKLAHQQNLELGLHCRHMLQVGERRLHVSVAQNGPRFQKSAPRGFEQPPPPYGSPMNAYPPSFPVSMPGRFPVPVSCFRSSCAGSLEARCPEGTLGNPVVGLLCSLEELHVLLRCLLLFLTLC